MRSGTTTLTALPEGQRPWSFAPNLTRKTFEKVFLDFSKLLTKGL